MARIAVIGDPLRIYGYGLAGALTYPIGDEPEALRVWRELPRDVAVVVITPQVADWLADELADRPDALPVVLPEFDAAAAAASVSAAE
jgi:vacuolar-type H+-ATPase subunit F/Vma7